MGGLSSINLTLSHTPNDVVRIDLPASKSISNRALIIQKLAGKGIEIENLSQAEDTTFLAKALEKDSGEIWMGDAGTASRFTLAYASISDGVRIIKGSERLSQRPMKPLVDALRILGADIICLEREGFLPMRVTGKKLSGGLVEIDASISSQFVSALMMIAPLMEEGLKIVFRGVPTSIPYLNITREVMLRYGATVKLSTESIAIAPTGYGDGRLKVESDWSAASYFFSAVALNPHLKIFLKGLEGNSIQGDSKLVDIYTPLGVNSEFQEAGLLLTYSRKAAPLGVLHLVDTPDLAQTVVVTYAGLGLGVECKGLHTLKVKETDRLEALVNELQRVGVKAHATEDTIKVHESNSLVSNVRIKTYGDHRMAMSFAPLVFKVPISFEDPAVVAKSFPAFFDEFAKLGVNLER
jgi:3-phosphoshikimate 1-carboxyvinyltransferase